MKLLSHIALAFALIAVSCDMPTSNKAVKEREVVFQMEIKEPHDPEKDPLPDLYEDQVIFSPLTININSKGRWLAHEGELGYVDLFDNQDSLLAKSVMSSKDGKWMTTGDAWFTSDIEFDNGSSVKGKLVFHNNFISDEGGNKQERFELPVYFGSAFTESLCFVEKVPSPIEGGEYNYHFINMRLNSEGMVMGSLIGAPYGTDGYRASFLGELDQESGKVSGTLRRLAEGELSKERVFYFIRDDRIEFEFSDSDGRPYSVEKITCQEYERIYQEYEDDIMARALNVRDRERLYGLITLKEYGFGSGGLSEVRFCEREVDLDSSWMTSEYLLYMMDPMICGSGGCTMFVMNEKGDVLSRSSVVKLPVYMRTSRIGQESLSGNGWKDLIVWSDHSYRQLTYFDKGYSSNASMASAMAEENLNCYPEKYFKIMDYPD